MLGLSIKQGGLYAVPSQNSDKDTPYYHCCSRVVRRAFLYGDDAYSGKTMTIAVVGLSHYCLNLKPFFAIDVAAFAVMSNHLHVVLRVDIDSANRWTD